MTCVTGRVSPKCLECGALPLGRVHGQGLKGQVWPWRGGEGEQEKSWGLSHFLISSDYHPRGFEVASSKLWHIL